MRTLLVDDEPLARLELRRLLAAFPWIEIVGEAAHVDDAVAQIDALSPALVLLDVQMPGGTGFDVLERVAHVPLVIFTTAYDNHAVRAFEVDALDYLVKPVEPRRLATALARVQDQARAAPVRSDAIERLFVRDRGRCWFVPVHEVRLLASEGNFVRLYFHDAQPYLASSLVALEPRLDERRFFRANRHQIVNLDFIERIEVSAGGGLDIELRGGPPVEMSRRQARLFRARMA